MGSLLQGQDVLAVLPSGFGKSLIFTVFGLAIAKASIEERTVLVISPLRSILTTDQIFELDGMCTARELACTMRI